MLSTLPSSGSWELKLKDWIKGLGLTVLVAIASTAPDLKEILTAHDFGAYNDVVRIAIVIIGWLLQRWIRDTRPSPVEVPIDTAGTEST